MNAPRPVERQARHCVAASNVADGPNGTPRLAREVRGWMGW